MTQEQILSRLQDKFPGADIQVYDMTGTQDHWAVNISASAFTGLTRIQQHKLVMDAFDNELKTGEVHALTMKTKEIKQ